MSCFGCNQRLRYGWGRNLEGLGHLPTPDLFWVKEKTRSTKEKTSTSIVRKIPTCRPMKAKTPAVRRSGTGAQRTSQP